MIKVCRLTLAIGIILTFFELGFRLTESAHQKRVYGQDTQADKIAFVVYDVYSINADGSNEIQLSDIKPGPSEHPTWSPDGTQIAFDAQIEVMEAGGEPLRQIFVVDVETLEIKRLPTDAKPSFFPVWSPVEDRIAYISYGQGLGIYIMNSDGSNQTKLIEIGGEITGLTWSNDGKSIIYAEDAGLDTNIFIVDVDQSLAADGKVPPTNFTDEIEICEGLTNYYHPVWSPIDPQIAVLVDCGFYTDIYLLNLDSSTKEIISYTNRTMGDIEKTGLINPIAGLSWSPDGQKLAFVSHFGSENTEIRFVDLAQAPENLSITQVTVSGSQPGYLHPSWQPRIRNNQ